jgi:hypothetical protein
MTHAEAAAHLRTEVAGVAEPATRPLLELENSGYFGAVLLTMCAADYVGALHTGMKLKGR